MINKVVLYLLIMSLCTSCVLLPDFSKKEAIKYNFGDTVIFGKLKIINENGKDITSSCATRTLEIAYGKGYKEDFVKNQPIYKHFIKKNGFYLSKAQAGDNTLYAVICKEKRFLDYPLIRKIPSKQIYINVPYEKVAVYFGDAIITLNKNLTYDIKTLGYSDPLYKGNLSIINGVIEVKDKGNFWQKDIELILLAP